MKLLPPLVLLASAGCAPSPAIVKHDLWKDLRAPAQGDYHLLLVWKAPRFGAGDAAALRPEGLAEAVGAEAAARAVGTQRSYQVVEDYDELAAVLPLWRPRAPVLLLEVSPAVSRSSSSTLVGFGARARYQPFVFDTSTSWRRVQGALQAPWGSKLKARAAEKTRWLADNAAAVARVFASALFSSLTLEPQPSALKLRAGKGEGMAAAYALALSSGDWQGAAELWEREARSSLKNDAALANLSVSKEMLGDWEGAAYWEEQRKPSLFSSDGDRLAMLRGLALLYARKGGHREHAERRGSAVRTSGTPQDPEARTERRTPAVRTSGTPQDPEARTERRTPAVRPGANVAVLPLDNETPDLAAAEQVRKRLAAALQEAGYAPLDISALDDKLQKAGFTDGGQLKALTPEKLARLVGADLLVAGSVEEFRTVPLGIYFRREVRATLRVLDGKDGRALFQKTAGVVRETLPGESDELAAEFVALISGKAKNDSLPEESAETSRRFIRPWPHFHRDHADNSSSTPSPSGEGREGELHLPSGLRR